MPITAACLPASAVNTVSSVDDVAWSNPSNVLLDDGNYATSQPNNTGRKTQFLDALGYDFSAELEGDERIDWLEIDVYHRSDNITLTPRTYSAQILLDGEPVGTANVLGGIVWPTTTTDEVYSFYDGVGGLSVTIAQAIAGRLGVRLQGVRDAGESGPTFSLSHVTMQIHYNGDDVDAGPVAKIFTVEPGTRVFDVKRGGLPA